MSTAPFKYPDDPLMLLAWRDGLLWAIGEEEIRKRFEADCGRMFIEPARNAIDALIDQATGVDTYAAETIIRFVEWFNENVWGHDTVTHQAAHPPVVIREQDIFNAAHDTLARLAPTLKSASTGVHARARDSIRYTIKRWLGPMDADTAWRWTRSVEDAKAWRARVASITANDVRHICISVRGKGTKTERLVEAALEAAEECGA